MPWTIHEREGKWCVVKDSDGEVEGCHDSRAKALAQQRALYSSESSMGASLELDWSELDFDPAPKPILLEVGQPPAPPPLRIEVTPAPVETDEMLVAALTGLSDRLRETEERQAEILKITQQLAETVNADREHISVSLDALTAALKDQPAPIVNVAPAEIEIPAPVVNVQPPEVNIQYTPPKTSKQITVTRDPITGAISSATAEEVG